MKKKLALNLHYRLTRDNNAMTRNATAAQKKLAVRSHTTNAMMAAGRMNSRTFAISMIMTSPITSSRNKKMMSPVNPKIWSDVRSNKERTSLSILLGSFLKSLWLSDYSHSLERQFLLDPFLTFQFLSKSSLTEQLFYMRITCSVEGKKEGVGAAHLPPIPFFFPISRIFWPLENLLSVGVEAFCEIQVSCVILENRKSFENKLRSC